MLKGGASVKPLVCQIVPPQNGENIIFSITHRAVIMAMRRGILEGIDTLDELFDGRGGRKSHQIKVSCDQYPSLKRDMSLILIWLTDQTQIPEQADSRRGRAGRLWT